MDDINLELNEKEIQTMSKNKFKNMVKTKVNICASEYLKNIQTQQSKTRHLKINKNFKPAEYLFSKKLTVPEIQTLFRMRSRTINVKLNQKSSYIGNYLCRHCKLVDECQVIRSKVSHINFNEVKLEMMFGKLEDQERIAKVYHSIVEFHNENQ